MLFFLHLPLTTVYVPCISWHITHCYAFIVSFLLKITNKQNIKIMRQLTEIEKQELEIHRVDNEDLIFETEFDGLLSISKVGDSVGFEVIREETIYLSKEQIKFLLEWLSE